MGVQFTHGVREGQCPDCPYVILYHFNAGPVDYRQIAEEARLSVDPVAVPDSRPAFGTGFRYHE